jgi:hypothetical protein
LNSQLAIKLVNMLQEASPYDTGQLHDSIQMHQINDKEWIITVGDGTTAKHEVPSEVYAHITNDYQTLGKYGKANRNYHWVNKILKKWAEENMLQFEIESDDEDE